MTRQGTQKKTFAKIADVLPEGFNSDPVAKVFAGGSVDHTFSKIPIGSLHTKDAISPSAPIDAFAHPLSHEHEGHAQSPDIAIPAQALKSIFSTAFSADAIDLNGGSLDHNLGMIQMDLLHGKGSFSPWASIDPSAHPLSHGGEERAQGHDAAMPAQALKSMFSTIFSPDTIDLDGAAKPTFNKGSGGDGGKLVHGDTTSDPTLTTAPAPLPTIASADYVSGKDTPDGYNVELMFKGTWSDAAKAQAYAAAEKISDIVTGDLPSYNGIDDIRITLTSASIDGTGGTWGKGGYDILRSDSKLAATGHVTIDSADIPQALKLGLLDDLLQHEMLHAMGFGTAWKAMGLVNDYNGDLRFNGANATQVYNTLFDSLASRDPLSDKGVPIETDGGSSAVGKHWDEATFGNEIMSTMLNYSNNTTQLTIAALEDMGYQTTFADHFLFA